MFRGLILFVSLTALPMLRGNVQLLSSLPNGAVTKAIAQACHYEGRPEIAKTTAQRSRSLRRDGIPLATPVGGHSASLLAPGSLWQLIAPDRLGNSRK